MPDRSRGARRGRRRPNVVASTVVAVATVGVTGVTLSWAMGTTLPSNGAAIASAAQVSSQIAADQAAIVRLRQSISSTGSQLAGIGTVDTSAPAAPGATSSGTSNAAATTGPAGTSSLSPGTTGSVAGSGARPVANAAPGASPAPAAAAPSGGPTVAPSTPAVAPQPAPTPPDPGADSSARDHSGPCPRPASGDGDHRCVVGHSMSRQHS